MNKTDKALKAYQNAINKIDDYFEYSNESERDKAVVRAHLAELTQNLKAIYTTDHLGFEELVDEVIRLTGQSRSVATVAVRNAIQAEPAPARTLVYAVEIAKAEKL